MEEKKTFITPSLYDCENKIQLLRRMSNSIKPFVDLYWIQRLQFVDKEAKVINDRIRSMSPWVMESNS